MGDRLNLSQLALFLLKYKAQFGRDAIQDIFKLQNAIDTETNELVNYEALDLEVFYNLIWTLAKTADPSLPPPMEWLDGFSEFPLIDIIPEVIDMIFSCLKSTVNSKKK